MVLGYLLSPVTIFKGSGVTGWFALNAITQNKRDAEMIPGTIATNFNYVNPKLTIFFFHLA
jgi:hypothetical protein